MNPLDFCRTIADELNVKRLTWPTPFHGDGRPITLVWQGGDLDLFHGEVPQFKPDLAKRIFNELILPKL